MRLSLTLLAYTAAALLLACANSAVHAQLPPRSERARQGARRLTLCAIGEQWGSSCPTQECGRIVRTNGEEVDWRDRTSESTRCSTGRPRSSRPSLTVCLSLLCPLLLLRLGFCVSSSPSISPRTCDVVLDGVVQGNWTAANQGNEFIPNIFQAELYMSMDPAAAQGDQYVTVVYGGAEPPVGESPAGHWNMLDEGVTVTSNPSFINGTLTCDRLGFGVFTVAINPDGGAAWNPMIIYFAKQCSWPSLSIGSYNADNNVMVHTVPVSTFSNYIMTETTGNNFYVSLEEAQGDPTLTLQPFNLVIQSTNPAELTITPTGGIGWTGYAELGQAPWSIGAHYACSNTTTGPLDIVVVGNLTFGWSVPSAFSFIYRCRAGTPMQGLTIGTVEGGIDIAMDGIPQGLWNGTRVYTPDQMYDWIIYVQSNIQSTVPYTINLWSQDESIMVFNATSPLSGQIVWLNGAPAPIIFIAEMVCIAPGTTRGMFQMEMQQAAPVTLLFKYTCALPLFNVGVQPFGTDVIAQGVYNATGLWSGHSDGNALSTNLFVILDAANIAPSNPFGFRLISNDEGVTTPSVEDVGLQGNATKDGARSSQNPIVLTFNCAPCVEAMASQIVYEMDWGWSPAVQITFTKDCVILNPDECATGGNGGSPGGSGLGGAAIAAIVITVIIAAFCVSGCAFNKFHSGKSGWSVIPCSEQAAACFDSAQTGGRAKQWTPQENHYDPAETGTVSSGGGGYQSYSSNL